MKTKTITRTPFSTISIDPVIHKRIKVKARKREMSIKEYTEKALKAFSKN